MAVSTIDSTGLTASGVTPASLDSNAQYTGFKNRIINGGMVLDQRNAGAALTMGTSTAGTYGLDRWAGYTGTGSLWQMQRVSTGNLDFPYAMRMQRIAAQTSTSAIYYSQIIETVNTYGLAGQSITLSFYITAGANYSGGSSFGFQIVNGTAADQGTSLLNAGSWTGAAYPGTTLTPTTTRTLVTYTTTLGASVQELAVRFYWAPSGTAGAADYVDITGVQLEKGSTATSFDYRPYGTELALCQRYCFVPASNSRYVGQCDATTRALIIYVFPQTMRSGPNATLASAATYNVTTAAGGTVAGTSVALSGGYTNTAQVAISVASGLVAGNATLVTASGTTIFSAEL